MKKVEVGRAYHLYAKADNTKYFRPVDINAGTTTTKLIFATILEVPNEERVQKLHADIDDLIDSNPGWTFEYRSIDGWEVK